MQNVDNRNWLRRVVHPLGGHHRGQVFGEITQHLERCRARPDDHPSPQFDNWHTGASQHLAHRSARLQMLAQVFVVGDAAQIYDALDTHSRRCLGKRAGHGRLEIIKFCARTNGVQQVKRHVHTGKRLIKRSNTHGVTFDYFHLVNPGRIRHLRSRAHEHAHSKTFFHQQRRKSPTHIPSGPSDQYPSCGLGWCHECEH